MQFTLFKKKKVEPKVAKEFRSERIGKKASREWEIMLIVFVILNLAIGGGAAYFFNKVSSGEIFKSDEVFTEAQDIDVSVLKTIVARFEAKEIEFESLKASTTIQIDPSL